MKTRRIISLLTSLSVIASSFVALGTAAFAADVPTYIIECKEVNDFTGEYAQFKDDVDWTEYEEEGLDYQTYSITVKATGLDDLGMTSVKSGKKTIIQGRSIISAGVNMSIATEGVYNEDYTNCVAYKMSNQTVAEENAMNFVVADTLAIYPTADAEATVTKDDISPKFCEYLITVDKSKPVTINITPKELATGSFSAGSIVAGGNKGITPIANINTLTLPLSEEPPVVDTTPKTLKPGDVIEGIDIAKNPGKEDNVFYYVKTVAEGANAAGHAKITNVTLGESVRTSRTIAQLLGGEAAEGATIEGAIVVVISGPVDNEFDFEIVD